MRNALLLLSLVITASCSSGVPERAADPPVRGSRPAPEATASIPDSEIGLAPGTAYEQPPQEAIVFNTVDPGESEIRPRPNAEFPPVIPHTIEGMGPISVSENPCLECHAHDVAEDMGAVALPPSHRMDLRNSPGVVGKTATGARFVCTSCHVAQTGSGS